MRKTLLFSIFSVFTVFSGIAQTEKAWTSVVGEKNMAITKTATRSTFPENYLLFKLDLTSIKQALSNAQDRFAINANGVIIALPNAEGKLEHFKMFEASNFDAQLQAQFPEIRSYVGIGIEDTYAQVRLSIDPKGMQTMVFRADKKNEFMEPFSEDGKIYAVYNSQRTKGKLPFTCSTTEQSITQELGRNLNEVNRSSTTTLLTFRLALSCTAEYANYFGATSASQASLVLAAFNATMARVNGVFEKDFAIHMNITANSSSVIYYDAASDPYSDAASMNNWNAELQANLTATITESTYDIGHLFGATGGGGNAGCIGCVCVNGSKGSGITSPADAIPAGDNFDIDYVAHEMGHQFGANHTFTHSTENNAVNYEVGSGSTIMGYAGITSYDVQPHSDDYFHAGSIAQVQANMGTKTCPTSVALTHSAPVVNAGATFTIPKSTPFMLTGSATDAGGGSLTYCWEQYDDASATAQLTTGSPASATKTAGPNFRSYAPSASPTRYFPRMASVLNGSTTTAGTDCLVEALNSNARTLNFRLTVRDNVANGGQTNFANTSVTVDATKGPLTVTSQSTDGISYPVSSSQTVTWLVNNTSALTGGANVDILLSTNGGSTWTTLLANTPNDGSEAVTLPATPAAFCRLMVKANGNAFFNVNSKDFAIGYVVTNTCNTYSSSPALAIPDGSGTTGPVPGAVVSSTISVPVTYTLSDVNVNLDVTHTYINDLDIAVNHPDATQVFLWSGFCGSQNNFNITFSDGNPTPTCTGNDTSGTFAPATPLNTLNEKPANGTWTILGRDNWSGDTGTINSWSVEVCSQTLTPLSTESFGLENFSIYPNPNNGNFTVNFTSQSSNAIEIMVHDIRGREVYMKSFNNSSLFNQTIQLANVETGIYLVTVKDGERKEVKKIIIE
jgi:subtilisin-like proprotein convertase family protein